MTAASGDEPRAAIFIDAVFSDYCPEQYEIKLDIAPMTDIFYWHR